MPLEILYFSLFGICILWLSFVTVVLIKLHRHYNRLTHGATQGGLQDVLNKLLNNHEQLRLEVKQVQTRTKEIQSNDLSHIQRIGVVRFNPFADTGGNQSFTLALLDGTNSGIVITSLYARGGGRWYSKEVASGKGKHMVLSREEEEAIARAGKAIS